MHKREESADRFDKIEHEHAAGPRANAFITFRAVASLCAHIAPIKFRTPCEYQVPHNKIRRKIAFETTYAG